MTAYEISKAELTNVRTKPVFVQGIMQDSLRELTAACDALVNGLLLRLPSGCVISLTAGGSGGALGQLMTELTFVGRDGAKYRTVKGMSLQIPA